MYFFFSGTNVTLQPADFLIGPTEGDPNLCLSWPTAQLPPEDDGIDWHLGGFIAVVLRLSYQCVIIGLSFLRTVYTAYRFVDTATCLIC